MSTSGMHRRPFEGRHLAVSIFFLYYSIYFLIILYLKGYIN